MFCVCVCVRSLGFTRHTYLGSFFSDLEDIRSVNLGTNCNTAYMTWHQIMGHKGPVQRTRCIGTERARTHSLLYSILTYTLQRMWSMTAMDQSLSDDFTEGLRDGVIAGRSDVKWAFGKKGAGL